MAFADFHWWKHPSSQPPLNHQWDVTQCGMGKRDPESALDKQCASERQRPPRWLRKGWCRLWPGAPESEVHSYGKCNRERFSMALQTKGSYCISTFGLIMYETYPPKFPYLDFNPHSDGIWRWSLQEMTRSSVWSPNGGEQCHSKTTAICGLGNGPSLDIMSAMPCPWTSQPPELREINV